MNTNSANSATNTTKRPIIGYPTRAAIATEEFTALRFANNESYAYAIADNGGAPIMLPSVADDEILGRLYETLDGLLLPGGPDVSPARYGQERHPKTDNGDPALEHAEAYLTRRALADGLPILGICRGLQALNVVAGGTLYQDVKDEYSRHRDDAPITHPAYDEPRTTHAHSVRVAEGSCLGQIAGRAHLPVNSLHHQAVRDLAPGFTVTATAPDGLVEAIERPGEPFVVAVQWHPEELYAADETQANLFKAFVAAAAAYRQRRGQR